MASLESSSKICALCTKCTNYSIHSILGDGGGEGGGELLQRFNCEFNLLPTNTATDNWSLCQNCLPDIQSAVHSKEKVNLMESQVRKLQLDLLRQLENLSKEVNQMQGHLTKIHQTVLSSPSPKSSQDPDVTIKLFQQKIIAVVRDLQTWQASTSKKLLQKTLPNPDPPYIKEEEPEPQSADHPIYPDNYLDNLEPGQHWLFFQDDNPSPTSPPVASPNQPEKEAPSSTSEPPQKLRRSTTKKKYFESDSSSSPFEDPDFDPTDLTMAKPLTSDKHPPKLLKGLSPFRLALISRVRSRNTTATSTSIPLHDRQDPRRPFAIKYFSVGGPRKINRFFLEDHEILCLDEEKALKCGTCDYTVDKSKLKGGWKHTIEDNMFDHILSKHLNLFTCGTCGLSFDNYARLRGHRVTHLGREERAKFFCEICGKPVIRESTLRTHKWTHLSEEEKRDEGNGWMMPYQLRPTMVMGMRFQCATCGLEAKTEGNLRIHERTHLGMEEREGEMVVCAECGVKMLRTNLRRHRRRRHGGDKGEGRGRGRKGN